jgi:hypothetical protein
LKATLFLPCQEQIDAEGVAKLYANQVFPHFGIPKKLITDRDTQFTAKFTKELCRILQVQQNISSTYHPQTDGQSKRSNQWLKQFLRIYTNGAQDNWSNWLPIAQYTHNAWPNSTTKKSPFELIMGFIPRAHQVLQMHKVPELAKWSTYIDKLQLAAQTVIRKAQKLMAE